MSDKLIDQSCSDFTAALSTKAPVPGGGGAAALMGALGAALCAMAANLTIGKPKFIEKEQNLQEITLRAEMLRQRMLTMVDEDALAFEPLSKAYAMPKDAPDYAEVMKKVTIGACRVPLETMKCACGVIDALNALLNQCSRLVLSDVGCGAVAAKAALETAAMNVFVNTRTLPEDAEANEIEINALRLLQEYKEKADEVSVAVMNELRRK